MLLVDPVAEPGVDVFDEERVLVVLVQLPGVAPQDIEVRVMDDVFSIEAKQSGAGGCHYTREVLLPFPVANASLRSSFRNGILEVELRKAPDGSTGQKGEI